MKIKLTCNKCGYVVYKEDSEYMSQDFRYCTCGGKLSLQVTGSAIKEDLCEQAEAKIKRWIKRFGLEGTIELVERNKHMACARIYKEILEKRGYKVNFDV